LSSAKAEPSLAEAEPGDRFQFYRKSYVCVDPDSTEVRLIFNRTVPLRSTWAKIAKRMKQK
jgi:glutaminyl-tRNA synthetase